MRICSPAASPDRKRRGRRDLTRHLRQFDQQAMTWATLPGAARYETGNVAEPLVAAALAGVRYVDDLGVDRIAAHARRLT